MKPRTPCTSPNGRHRWRHLKNTTAKSIHAGPFGTAVEIKTTGLYCCTTCGKRKAGNPAQEAPAQ